MKTFRVGIIGAGHIAEKMAATLNGMKETEAYGVASRNIDKARDFAEKFNVSKAYGSYGELAEDPDVDLIYVATPHTFHYSHVRMCLEKGKPVLCEKSFMADAAQAEDIFRLSDEKSLLVAEAIWTRYMPFYRTIRERACDGSIGKPMMVTAHLGYKVDHKERIMKPELGGGALLDLGVYTINFAFNVFGSDISSFSSDCVKSDTGIDLQNSITMKYPDGKMAVLMSTACCANDRQGIISGDGGFIIVDNINNPRRADIYDKAGRLSETIHAPEQITGFEYQVRSCIGAIEKRKTETEEMPHSESLKVMKIMDSLRKSWGVKFPDDKF